MKKLLRTLCSVIIAAVLFAGMAVTLAACGGAKDKAVFMFKNGETVTSVNIEIGDFKTVYDALKSEKYADELNADISESSYGPFLNSIKSIEPDTAAGEYISIYYSTDDYYDPDWGSETTVSGKTFYSVNVGIGELPLVKNATYLFALEIYLAPDTAVFMFKNGETVSSEIIEIDGLETVYNALSSVKYASLNADMEEGSFGWFINSIYGIEPDFIAGEYISLYSTLEEFYDSEWGETIIVSEITFYSSGVGISDMPLVKNAVYLFALEIYVFE